MMPEMPDDADFEDEDSVFNSVFTIMDWLDEANNLTDEDPANDDETSGAEWDENAQWPEENDEEEEAGDE